jgi:hypothetical protein
VVRESTFEVSQAGSRSPVGLSRGHGHDRSAVVTVLLRKNGRPVKLTVGHW